MSVYKAGQETTWRNQDVAGTVLAYVTSNPGKTIWEIASATQLSPSSVEWAVLTHHLLDYVRWGDLLKPVLKGRIFNESKNKDTNLFTTNLKPTQVPCYFEIYVLLDTSSTIKCLRKVSTTTITGILNEGTALAANCDYAFSNLLTDEDTEINYQLGTAAKIYELSIVETYTEV